MPSAWERSLRPQPAPSSPAGLSRMSGGERLIAARLEREDQARQKKAEQDRLDGEAQARIRAQYGEQSMFPGSGSAGVRPTPTAEEQSEARGAALRGLRDFAVPYQEVKRSVSAGSEGRPLAAAGWGGLAALGAIPYVGPALRGARGVAGASSGAVRAGTGRAAADVARASRGQDISQNLANEFRSGSFQYASAPERAARAGHYQKDTVEIFSRQGFDGPPAIIPRVQFQELRNSGEYIPIYRGVRDYEGIPAKRFVDEFNQGEFFIGGGTLGNGAYFTTSSKLAESYRASGNTIEALVPSNARIFNLDSLDAQRIMLEKQRSPFRDLADFLSAKGYDGLRSGDNIVLYNRSAAIVPGS